MSQLVLSAIPGFFDLADSAIAAGKPLTDDTMLKISHNAKFSAVRGKLIFMGFYAHGNIVPTPIDPDDYYEYARSECQFAATIYSNRAPAPGMVPGQVVPPPQSDNQAGPLYNFPGGWDINDVTGLVTLWTSYYAHGAETVNNDGIIKVYAICSRMSSTSRPGPPAPPAPTPPTPAQPSPVTYTPTPPPFSPPAGAEFFLPDTYLDSGTYQTINPTISDEGGYIGALVCGLNYPGFGVFIGDCTWYGFSNPSGSKTGVSLTVYSRQVASSITPALGTVRYSLDGGTTWTNIRSSTGLWDASTTPDVVALADSQDFSLVRVEVSQAAPSQPGVFGTNIFHIFMTASLSS